MCTMRGPWPRRGPAPPGPALAQSGCEELATGSGLVPPGQWTFVAATIDERGDAALFINGQLRVSDRH